MTGSTYVGRRVPRVEDLRLLRGAGEFVDDVSRAGELHAHVIRSSIAHGALRAIDTTAAERLDGVVKVVTAADIPEVTVPVRLLPTPASDAVQQPVLAHDVVRYVGEPIAVAIATDRYAAEDAAEAVEIEIEPLVPTLEIEDAIRPGAAVLHPSIGTNTVDTTRVAHGASFDDLVREAAIHVAEDFSIQRHGAVPMETRGLVADYDARSGKLTVWGPAKVKHFNLGILARMLELPADRIRFLECDVGGGFGARGEFYPEDYLIPWLAIELGRPVKWIEDRSESLIAMNQSREQRWRFEIAADAEGRLLAFRAKGYFNQGAYARTHGTILMPKIMLNHIAGPYRWLGLEAEATSVLTNKTPAGTYRGPGQYEPTFVRERMLDIVAVQLGIDSAELRTRNLIKPTDQPYETGLPAYVGKESIVVDDGDYPRVWRELLKRTNYRDLKSRIGDRRARGELVGIGLSTYVEIGAPGAFEQARVVAEKNRRFTVHVGIASVGQGVETSLAQIAADGLGVDIDRVTISYKDTDIVPEGLGAFSSRTTMFGGNAVAGAVATFVANAREAAAEALGSDPDRLVLVDGKIGLEGEEMIALSDLEIAGDYRYEPGPRAHVAMGANLAVARIDPSSANPVVERYAVAYDVGRVINPLTLEGQIKGGVVQGIGGALLEQFHYDDEGQPLSTSFMDYCIPTAAESPPIEVFLLELGSPTAANPLAAKGGAEGGIVGVGAAVANAVADALGEHGHDVISLPLHPGVMRQRVDAAIQELSAPSRDR